MSMNHDEKNSGCCGGSSKPAPQAIQQSDVQAVIPDVKTETPPPKPTTPQPKSKSCCG
jgi:hypothetical protein